jgi:uncharacterized membrane protein
MAQENEAHKSDEIVTEMQTSASPASHLHQRESFADASQPSPESNIQRIIALSDCVIAVALTLLVINIRLPESNWSEPQLANYILHSVLPDTLVYLFSYIVVTISWISHYRIFNHLKRSSSTFIMLNVLFLGSMVFLPVPVAVFYLYSNQLLVWILYACTQLVTSITLLFMWLDARIDHLLDSDISANILTATTLRLLVLPLSTLISIGLAFYNILLAEGVFILSYIFGLLLHNIYYHKNRTDNVIEGATRLYSITDNMVAVAITFLITKITGTLISNVNQPLPTMLKAIFEQLQVYGFSLLVVGFYWLSHHRIFMIIRRSNLTLIWLNFAFLLFIELQPIINYLRANYPGSQVTAEYYTTIQAVTGLMLLFVWLYAARGHRLIDRAMHASQITSLTLRVLWTPMIFILSLGAILFRNSYTIYTWLLVLILNLAALIYERVRYGKRQQQESLL